MGEIEIVKCHKCGQSCSNCFQLCHKYEQLCHKYGRLCHKCYMLYRWAIVKHCAMSNLDMNQAPRIRNYWSFCCVTENPNHNLITAPCHICLSFRFDEKDNISEIRPRSMTLPGRKVFIARLKGRNIHASYTLHILSHH